MGGEQGAPEDPKEVHLILKNKDHKVAGSGDLLTVCSVIHYNFLLWVFRSSLLAKKACSRSSSFRLHPGGSAS